MRENTNSHYRRRDKEKARSKLAARPGEMQQTEIPPAPLDEFYRIAFDLSPISTRRRMASEREGLSGCFIRRSYLGITIQPGQRQSSRSDRFNPSRSDGGSSERRQ
jgi:hypothetical protein